MIQLMQFKNLKPILRILIGLVLWDGMVSFGLRKSSADVDQDTIFQQ